MKYPRGRTVGLQRQPAPTSEAPQWARWLIQRDHSVSVGLMQIQSDNLIRLGVTLEQAYDPCNNIALGAYILRLHYHAAAARIGPGPRAWIAAISSYNTGSPVAGIQNGYVRRILNRSTWK
jgi:type IV secretion system protein VirB1